MRTLRNKLALVTGAAGGIGRAIALELAREGANLVLVDLNQSSLELVAAEAKTLGAYVLSIAADVGRPCDVKRLVDTVLARFGGLDILVNNAGIAFYGLTDHMRDDQWDRLLAVNLHGPMLLTRRLLPTLLARPEAHVLNISSLAGLIPSARLTAYQVSKAGLIGFSESLRAEYGPRGLGVTVLCPGPVRTNMFRSAETSPGRIVPELPDWVHISPERVARRGVRAIRGRHGTVVVASLAKVMWAIKRYIPGLLDLAQQFRWRQRTIASAEPLLDRLAQSADPYAQTSNSQREQALVDDRVSA